MTYATYSGTTLDAMTYTDHDSGCAVTGCSITNCIWASEVASVVALTNVVWLTQLISSCAVTGLYVKCAILPPLTHNPNAKGCYYEKHNYKKYLQIKTNYKLTASLACAHHQAIILLMKLSFSAASNSKKCMTPPTPCT